MGDDLPSDACCANAGFTRFEQVEGLGTHTTQPSHRLPHKGRNCAVHIYCVVQFLSLQLSSCLYSLATYLSLLPFPSAVDGKYACSLFTVRELDAGRDDNACEMTCVSLKRGACWEEPSTAIIYCRFCCSF